MAELYLFDIPIYRLSREAFELDIEKRYRKRIDELQAYARPRGLSAAFAADVRDRLVTDNGGPWRFNQIVGWVRLFALGYQLRGEFFLLEAQRFIRSPKRKQFTWRGKAFELQPDPDATSAEIRAEILRALDDFRATDLRGRRSLDRVAFENLSRHVNWRGIVRLAARAYR